MSCSTNIAYHDTATFERDEIFRQVYFVRHFEIRHMSIVKPEITDLQSLTN